jgi:hypothetical protein
MSRRRATAALVAASFAGGALATIVAAAPDRSPANAAGGSAAARVPEADAGDTVVAPAFTVPPPRPLPRGEVARWAPVRRPVWARVAPAGPRLARLGLRTPDGTTNAVLAIGRNERHGRLWVHVRLPVLPNHRTGWVPRGALGGYTVVHTLLVVDRARLRATLYLRGRLVWSAPVGIGTPGAPTPAGRFYVRDRLTRFRSPFYGPIAFGTSARSPTLTDWPGGAIVGIHGTSEPGLIPGRISHGCIRLRNPDILRLARLMPVGTPLLVR